MSDRLLVTGSNGVLGRAVARRALAAGWEVTGVVRPGAEPLGGHPVHHVDLATDDLSGLVAAVAPRLVVHAGGAASVGASVADPVGDHRATVLTWLNVLEGVRRAGTGATVLQLGSAAVYGQPDVLPVPEDAPCRPLSPYGFHKLATEGLAEEYARCFGVPTVSTRVFSVLGPEQRRLLTWELACQALDGPAEVVVRGTGRESRDFLHVDDLADAVLGLGVLPLDPGEGTLRVNVATGRETTIAELAEAVVALAGRGGPVRYRGETVAADPQRWCADVGRLRTLLPDWHPRPLEEALRDCLTAWRPPD